MKYIDTHAHYTDKVYENNKEEILNKCITNNIDKIINVGYSLECSSESIELSQKYEYMYTTIGVHPHDVDSFDLSKLEELYISNKDSKIVAIGEIGLDYAFLKDNKEKQIEVFISQINLAKKYNLPIVVHSRDASLDTYNIIKDNVDDKYSLLFHCFAPTDDLVRLVIERGYFVAFGGNITYKRNESFKKYIEMIPIEQIVLETDCPYLSPEPLRGTVNDSTNLKYVCQKLAEFKKMDEQEVCRIVYDNSVKFFNFK